MLPVNIQPETRPPQQNINLLDHSASFYFSLTNLLSKMKEQQQQQIAKKTNWLTLIFVLHSCLQYVPLVAAARKETHRDENENLRGSLSSDKGRNLIVGGHPVRQPYPFFVEWTGCGGSLISEDMVLTAGKHPLNNSL